jgi:hypothetical protein
MASRLRSTTQFSYDCRTKFSIGFACIARSMKKPVIWYPPTGSSNLRDNGHIVLNLFHLQVLVLQFQDVVVSRPPVSEALRNPIVLPLGCVIRIALDFAGVQELLKRIASVMADAVEIIFPTPTVWRLRNGLKNLDLTID